MTKILLLLPMMAAAVCAQAQTRKVVPAGQAYTIGNVTSASGDNVTYQWFRDGEPIPNATSASYTVLASLAKMENGLNVYYTDGSKFQRVAYGIDCPGGTAMSNEVIIYFCELMVNGVCWAKANTDAYGRISSNPWDLGYFYQWNIPNVAYDATSPNYDWISTTDYAASWTNGYPCPIGWRLPTAQDFQNLHSMSQPVGGLWVEGGTRGIPSGVNGRLYGYNTAYCTMANLSGCIFQPAAGYRNVGGGLISSGTNGYYWGSEQSAYILGYMQDFDMSSSTTRGSNKSNVFSVRCVQDVQ